MTPDGYYQVNELLKRFGWKTRAMVSQVAQREKWRFEKVGRSNLYFASDVDAYALARTRTELAAQMGARRDLLRHDELDFVCLVCGGFAITKPPTLAETMSGAALPWRCVNGHGSEIEKKEET